MVCRSIIELCVMQCRAHETCILSSKAAYLLGGGLSGGGLDVGGGLSGGELESGGGLQMEAQSA